MESIFDTPRKSALRKKLAKKLALERRHKLKIKSLQKKNRRLKKKNASLQNILKDLQKKRFIDNDVANILSENVFAAELYNNLVKKKLKNIKRPMPKYTPEFRKFCLTLNFYSPRAYNYVRKTFQSSLPHPKTIYNWYRNINGSPGFTEESFKLLESKTQCSGKKIICALVADEMAIRPQNIKGGHGQVDLGAGATESSTKATEAYTFILVCLNEHWKIPLGYFLVHGLSGEQKSNTIKICLTKCEEVGVKVVALTFDAHATNISAMELLGCKIKDCRNMKTTFKHPAGEYDVAVFLDSNHMIKLVRNHFEDKKQFLDSEEKIVDWGFLVKLNDLQEKEGLHLANKLSRRHLEFKNSIMKVKLASQLLSRSIALALKFCRDVLKLDSFEDSEGTEKFIMIFNDLFDIFNSRRLTQHGFCHPLCPENKTEIFEYLENAKKYILNLKIKSTRKRKFSENQNTVQLKIKSFESVLAVKCSPGFKGLLICIESLKHLFKTLVEDSHELNYVTTYRLSQDHIELFFGSIRMHGGHNDNPNALQFKGSYRRLLCHMEFQVGETGNCVPLETVSILTCSSAVKNINTTTVAHRFDDADEELLNIVPNERFEDIPAEMTSIDDPDCKNHVVGYIAGNVVRHISTRIKCIACIDNMLAKDKKWFHKLVSLRDKGGLIYASKEVYSICSISEDSLRNYLKQNMNQTKNTEKELTLKIMSKLIGRSLFPNVDHSPHHDTNLARLIVERYLRIRFFYESKKDNMSQISSSKRQKFRKLLQFQGH